MRTGSFPFGLMRMPGRSALYVAASLLVPIAALLLPEGRPARAAEPAGVMQAPSPLEWTGGREVLNFLTELQFGGPNHADLPPLTTAGRHIIGRIAGGAAKGPRLSGTVLPLGEDWALLRPDGTLEIDVRLLVKTDDGAVIQIQYKGLWRGTNEMREKLLAGQDVGPQQYYLRMTPYFSTTSEKYAWLNSVVGVGYGYVQRGAGVRVRIYTVN